MAIGFDAVGGAAAGLAVGAPAAGLGLGCRRADGVGAQPRVSSCNGLGGAAPDRLAHWTWITSAWLAVMSIGAFELPGFDLCAGRACAAAERPGQATAGDQRPASSWRVFQGVMLAEFNDGRPNAEARLHS